MRRNIWAAAMALVLPTGGFAADKPWEGVFEGTVGTARVQVLLGHPDGNGEDSRYSYAGKPFDLGLVLENEGPRLQFLESTLVGAQSDDLKGKGARLISGRWDIAVSKDGASGTWADRDGKKTLPVTLTRVTKASGRTSDAYGEVWARQVAFAPPQPGKPFNGVSVSMVKDRIFAVSFPRLTSHPDPARMERINAMLEAEHRKAVASWRDCLSYVSRQKSGEGADRKNISSEITLQVTYATPRLLSLSEAGSIFCGGAHPNNFIRSINFDLVAAERIGPGNDGAEGVDPILSATQLGRIFDLSSKPKITAFNTFWWNRWLANARRKVKADDGCLERFETEKPDADSTADFRFEPRGLAVTHTDYPHAMSVCIVMDYNPHVIPWAQLKPFLKPGQRLLTDEVK
jgi:hypothetical protein